MTNGRTRVLVIGGGFGGLFCARRLGGADVDVTLLDRGASHVFQPLLYQCATGTLSIGQISRSLREELAHHRNVTTLLGEAIDLDAESCRLTARRPDETTFTLDYDVLVLAAGMRQSYFGHDEFAKWAPGMKTLDDALTIRRRIFAAFEIAETLSPGPERDGWLTFAVAGGGPTGVELAGQIREMATRALANEFHSIEPEDARVLLFDGGTCVLSSFAPALSAKAAAILAGLGVELHMGVHVTDVRREGITVTPKGGGPDEEYAARTVLWTAGVEGVPFAKRVADVLGATTDHAGRIAVGADLSVPGYPNVFVIGDLAGRDGLPGVAENAMQGGLHAAACVRRDLEGLPRKPYRYRDVGSAAYISRGHALLQFGPVKLSGVFGWLGWGLIHIAFLTGVQNRISTVATWLSAIARARRTDRSFMLGSPTTHELPYTWSACGPPQIGPPAAKEVRGLTGDASG
ncbi:NAD(P)/FAD-dependent oxidoreductase [Mycolicibacterium sp. 050158]|uniref:NAD(P)/FAD-dependent oxidoreductase n=1 Tax=Mycolicibacterium sp. 050158 TaxID=3090602 RepID=UPI00299E1BB4|nr:NAD(P)/FAD-dependent oxidoreductase [Mycolicibacterium sp. 050158]MDX1893346.1 NAD(P)/FAD-dependent oxidoreductase [Mycolicibacterium sp. 050158]